MKLLLRAVAPEPLAGTELEDQAGIIKGVSLCTIGPALGHFTWDEAEDVPKAIFIDETTLQQVLEAAAAKPNGLRAKLNHYSGAGDYVGRYLHPRLDGNQVRADLHLLAKSGKRDYLMELASTMPTEFGTSIEFEGAPEIVGDKAFARVDELFGSDIVDDPAANPTGLFAAKTGPNDSPVDTTKQEKTPASDQAETTPPIPMKLKLSKNKQGLQEVITADGTVVFRTKNAEEALRILRLAEATEESQFEAAPDEEKLEGDEEEVTLASLAQAVKELGEKVDAMNEGDDDDEEELDDEGDDKEKMARLKAEAEAAKTKLAAAEAKLESAKGGKPISTNTQPEPEGARSRWSKDFHEKAKVRGLKA